LKLHEFDKFHITFFVIVRLLKFKRQTIIKTKLEIPKIYGRQYFIKTARELPNKIRQFQVKYL